MVEVRHHPHRLVNVGEEGSVTGAQVVKTRIAIRRVKETIFRTLAMTDEVHRAHLAILWKRIPLGTAELALLLASDQLDQMPFLDITQQVVWLYEMIA